MARINRERKIFIGIVFALFLALLAPTSFAQVSQFIIGRGGAFTSAVFFPDGTASAPSISFASASNTGLYQRLTNNAIGLSLNGNAWVDFNTTNAIGLRNDGVLGWSSSATPGAVDTSLARGGAAGKITLTGTTPTLQFGGTSSSFPALKQNGTRVDFRLADDSANASLLAANATLSGSVFMGGSGVLLINSTAPTISSGFGTSPSVVNSNGTAAFTVNVGTGGVATSGVIGLPAATTGWSCFANDRNTNIVTRQTATTTTTATFTAASAWTASDILNISCFAY